MRIFKLSKRSSDWFIVSVWHCKFDGHLLCTCCQPKHVMPPQVLKSPDPNFRDYFRQTDSNGKSKTPRNSRHPDRRGEVVGRKGRLIT